VDRRELRDGEVEALAQHTIQSDDLKLGYAAQHAAEEAVVYKLTRMMLLSGAEPTGVEIEWVCQGRAIGVKGGPVIDMEVKVLTPAAPSCTVCGTQATRRLLSGQWRCTIHA